MLKHGLSIFAALALGVVAGSNVCSLALPGRSSAYECRFGFSPADVEEFDRQWDHAALAMRRQLTAGRRYEVQVRADIP